MTGVMVGGAPIRETEPDGTCSCGARRLNGHCTNYYWARGDELTALLEADREYLKKKEMETVSSNEVRDPRQPVSAVPDPVATCPSCGRSRPIGSWPWCEDGSGRHGHTLGRGGNRLTAIHTSERTVVFRNPRTGEIRYPARNDSPIHPKYAAQGYIREELASARDIARFEKETGRIHERSWCDPGSATAERSLETGLEAPKIEHLDQAYGDRELLGHIAVG
jgi:hypothetical protein